MNDLTETEFPILIHGNQTFGFGEDAETIPPVQVSSDFVLDIASGVEADFVSDGTGLNAIVGTDDSSVILVEDGAIVWDDAIGTQWEPGWYVWNSETSTWVNKIGSNGGSGSSSNNIPAGYTYFKDWLTASGLAGSWDAGTRSIAVSTMDRTKTAILDESQQMVCNGVSQTVDWFISADGFVYINQAELETALKIFGIV